MSRKRFANSALVDSIAQNIFMAYPIFRKKLLHMDFIKHEFNLPLSHVQVLAMLYDHGGMTISVISRRLGIAKPNITPLVNKLVESGLVNRARDKADKRMINVSISQTGVEKLKTIRQTIYDQVNLWTDDLSTNDLKTLNESLINVNRILGAVVQAR